MHNRFHRFSKVLAILFCPQFAIFSSGRFVPQLIVQIKNVCFRPLRIGCMLNEISANASFFAAAVLISKTAVECLRF
uniref:Secreted protein n=1 Tax=Ascaris lumbricoides TaxID=6252 RepID=A0A0M3HNX7_ASCLU